MILSTLLATAALATLHGVGTAAPACTIRGTHGDDVLRGTPARDVICGLRGDDILRGGGESDIGSGGPGDDRVTGGEGHDVFSDWAGSDRLRRGEGRDRLTVEGGLDTVVGGRGADLCLATYDGRPGDHVTGAEVDRWCEAGEAALPGI